VRYRSPFTIAAAASFLMLPSVSAHADCKTAAGDTCLVGTWKQTGGGASEWMREHMKMAQIKIEASDAMITLKGDGTLSTSKVDTNAEVTANDSQIVATGKMSSQGSGHWSAADGNLTLCMDAVEGQGTVELKMPGGKTMNVPVPKSKPTNASMTYTCDGATLSTVQAMPMNSTMTTTYTRVE
jgi:hypothetical protein